MLSLYITKLLKFWVNTSYNFGFISYYITASRDKEKRLGVIFNRSRARRFRIIFQACLFALYPLFLTRQLYQIIVYHQNDANFLQKTVKMVYYSFGYSFPLFYITHSLLRWNTLPKLLEAYLEFYNVSIAPSRKYDKRVPAVYKVQRQGVKLVTVLFIALLLVPIQNLKIALNQPYQPHLFTSVLKNPMGLPRYIKLAQALIIVPLTTATLSVSNINLF